MSWNIIKSTEEEIEFIDNTLGDYNKTQVQYIPQMDFLPLNFHIKDEAGRIIAGINALSCWQMLDISELYVDENYRGKGLGTLLINKIEDEARGLGSIMSHTDTFDWQAKDFYLKCGYEIFGVLENCPIGHKRFFLKKCL
ncbi:GNAT family N-acetyltransferase [bacterium]|nr:GNAT family N-acetyltransferase [bacterium]